MVSKKETTKVSLVASKIQLVSRREARRKKFAQSGAPVKDSSAQRKGKQGMGYERGLLVNSTKGGGSKQALDSRRMERDSRKREEEKRGNTNSERGPRGSTDCLGQILRERAPLAFYKKGGITQTRGEENVIPYLFLTGSVLGFCRKVDLSKKSKGASSNSSPTTLIPPELR